MIIEFIEMITSYLKLQEEYTEKYGNKTIVLCQVGSFYEMYEYSPEKDESGEVRAWPNKKIGIASDVSVDLNLSLHKHNKSNPYTLLNCETAGFPCISWPKHRDALLSNNYTIILVDQKKNGKDVERNVVEILSPGTDIENISLLSITNNIISIFIEVLKENNKYEDYTIIVGISNIDVTTGRNSVLEIYLKETDNIYALQEIYRFISSVRPKEALLSLTYKCKDEIKLKEYEKFIHTNLKLDEIDTIIFSTNKINPEFLKVEYCSRFLSKIFQDNIGRLKILSNPNVIEDLGLERIYYGMISYVILLQYCYEHNPTLIEKLDKPDTSYLDEDKYLTLTHNAIEQLDLLPSKLKKKHNCSNKNIDSLFSVLNFTKTALGKRYLMNILTNPITNVTKLNESYDMIEYLVKNPELLTKLSTLMSGIPDLERYQRKMYLKLIKPNEFVILFKAYISIISIYSKLYENESPLTKLLFDPKSFNECLSLVLSKYKLESFSNCKIENEKIEVSEKIFHDGVDETADKYWKEIDELKIKIENILNELNSHLGNTKGKKLDYSFKKEKIIGFLTTPHKANVLMKSHFNTNITGEIKIINVNKEVIITSDIIAETCSRYENILDELSKYLYSSYMGILNTISIKFKFFTTLNEFIGKLDYICSGGKSAIENKYNKPKIEEKDSSYCEILEMRHPIVEAIIPGEYVTNDICLTEKEKGMLLYGINSCGKSTMAKAIALNIIMAQSGLFTAGKMTFSPYNKIITRLSGHDSIMNGESSFVIEMKELRTILRQTDHKTLVVADEICRGTETISATALTIPAILFLIEKKSSFIFSTHNHSLVDIKEIIELGTKLKICHLTLRYDSETNLLIYDRKIKDGSGDSMYGLEVARSLGLDGNYIRKSYELRNEILKGNPLFLSTKKSRYNSKVFVDECFICGKRELNKLETHHIVEQHKFSPKDKRKNKSNNLIEICDECHDHLHANGLSIVSSETSKGIMLKTN